MYSNYQNDPAYQAALMGGGRAGGAPGPMANLIPGVSSLPSGFSWYRDQGRGGEGTGDWLIQAPSRQQRYGDPRSVTTYDENSDPTTSYQYWNRTPQPVDTNELGTIGGLLSPMSGGLSNLLAPTGNAVLGGGDPVSGPPGAGGNPLSNISSLLPLLLAGGIFGGQRPQRGILANSAPQETGMGGYINPIAQTNLQRIAMMGG